MSLSMKEKQTQTYRTDKWLLRSGVGEGWIGSLGLANANLIYKVDRQQGPTVLHRGLYSISYDKL